MKIGELSVAAEVAVETIRFYEREGLLEAPARERNGYRAYGPRHLERLAFIRHCRSLDVSLSDVRRLIRMLGDPTCQCHEVDAVIEEHLARVRARIAALQVLEDQLEALRARCSHPGVAGACGILGELARL